jgi:hypothetical protein
LCTHHVRGNKGIINLAFDAIEPLRIQRNCDSKALSQGLKILECTSTCKFLYLVLGWETTKTSHVSCAFFSFPKVLPSGDRFF